MHGRPDAKLVEMQRILKDAFDINVSLPTLSRTLKLKGCMKGFNKRRDICTAIKAPARIHAGNISTDGIILQPSPATQELEHYKSTKPNISFEHDLERHIGQPLEQITMNGILSPLVEVCQTLISMCRSFK